MPSLLFSEGIRKYCISRMYDLSFIVYFVSWCVVHDNKILFRMHIYCFLFGIAWEMRCSLVGGCGYACAQIRAPPRPVSTVGRAPTADQPTRATAHQSSRTMIVKLSVGGSSMLERYVWYMVSTEFSAYYTARLCSGLIVQMNFNFVHRPVTGPVR